MESEDGKSWRMTGQTYPDKNTCGRRDTYSLNPPDTWPACALPKGHDGVCDWHPAFGQENEKTVTYSVVLHATNGELVGCGLSLHECSVCRALVVEDSLEEHKLWHIRHL
jgi:hypothetical protein